MPRAALSQTVINYTQLGLWTDGCLPIVLIHGLAASSAFWFGVTQCLGASRPTLLFDLRGHGRSSVTVEGYSAARMAQDLLELLDFIGIESVILAGHSFGGSVALHTTLQHPERVRCLVLADVRLRLFQSRLTPSLWPKWQQRRDQLRELGLIMRDNELEAGVRMLTALARLSLDRRSDEDLPAWVVSFFGRRQSRFAAARWLHLVEQTTILKEFTEEGWLTPEALKTCSKPLLALYADESPLMTSGVKLKELRPDTKLQTVAEAGHFFPAVKPKRFVEALDAFLSSSELPVSKDAIDQHSLSAVDELDLPHSIVPAR
jgi:pimeloyl-ACP methyl ester carboxylesterase